MSELLTLYCGTWNVASLPPLIELDDWFQTRIELVDLYVVAFQEVDMDASALVMQQTENALKWKRQIELYLAKKAKKYVAIADKQLVGMLIFVYALEDIAKDVHDLAVTSIGCGPLGLGNKGAVGIRFLYNSYTFCFIDSHLAAGREKVEERNIHYKTIVDKMSFMRPDAPPGATVPQWTLFDHDFIFWLGDLNYQLDEIPDVQIRELVGRCEIDTLLRYDQLLRLRKEGRVFAGFEEGEVFFLPTYKYDVGTNKYDTSEKNRAPAWCDRIQWKEKNKKKRVQLLSYNRREITASDHRPVFALFELLLPIKAEEHNKWRLSFPVSPRGYWDGSILYCTKISTRSTRSASSLSSSASSAPPILSTDFEPNRYLSKSEADAFGQARARTASTQEAMSSNNIDSNNHHKTDPLEASDAIYSSSLDSSYSSSLDSSSASASAASSSSSSSSTSPSTFTSSSAASVSSDVFHPPSASPPSSLSDQADGIFQPVIENTDPLSRVHTDEPQNSSTTNGAINLSSPSESIPTEPLQLTDENLSKKAEASENKLEGSTGEVTKREIPAENADSRKKVVSELGTGVQMVRLVISQPGWFTPLQQEKLFPPDFFSYFGGEMKRCEHPLFNLPIFLLKRDGFQNGNLIKVTMYLDNIPVAFAETIYWNDADDAAVLANLHLFMQSLFS